jgi:hypothetical protein
MFKIDSITNRINPLEVKRFTDLGFTERKHLQEWLENYPQALTQDNGEELLIIQKKFDGFHDTRERLDLLANNNASTSETHTVLCRRQFGEVRAMNC